jgi:hypothetical protein
MFSLKILIPFIFVEESDHGESPSSIGIKKNSRMKLFMCVGENNFYKQNA